MYTFIQLPTIPYDYMIQRPQHIMRWLSLKGNVVYYIENYHMPYLIKKSEKLNIVGKGYNIHNFLVNKPIILWCSSPKHVLEINKYPHDHVVFDVVDNDTEDFKSWRMYTDTMIKKADLVFTASYALYEKYKVKHPKTYLIENAVDFELFRDVKYTPPYDIPSQGKIVGYVGAIAKWIDWKLIDFICSNSTYKYVFIGPSISNLSFIHRENKYRSSSNNKPTFLGYKEYHQVPNYIKSFDCCLIPFKLNSMTYASNPIKMYEYFSAGKPVVSTSIKAVEAYEDICYISNTKEEYLCSINSALKEQDASLYKRRIHVAEQNGWQSRVNEILNIINEFIY